MGVLVLLVVVIVVTWESKANSSSTGTGLQTGTELGNNDSLLTYSNRYKLNRKGLQLRARDQEELNV